MDTQKRSVGRPVTIGFKEQDRGYLTPCHIWQGSRLPNGYCLCTRGGRQQYAHRWAWEQKHGPIPEGLQLDHLCREPDCVNPDHLELVTPAENVRRGKIPKVNPLLVRQIRRLYSERRSNGLTQRTIAKRVGISQAQVSNIVSEKHWRDLDQAA